MTKSAIFSVFLSNAIAGTPYGESRMNEECVDLILGKLCNEQCVGYLVDCVSKCDNDSVCIANCGREESKAWFLIKVTCCRRILLFGLIFEYPSDPKN